jgi:SAM-dependent methyltransferase
MVSDIIAAARGYAGYQDASRLRQAQDPGWVLGRAPRDARSLTDLGCGTGALLTAAIELLPDLRRVLGLERSRSRIEEARRLLAPHGSRVEIRYADLLSPPRLGERFDVITMTSVLHWLFPREEEIFDWIAGHLEPGGVFLLTTYHPPVDADGFGGTDDVVREALDRLGFSDPVRAFADHGVIPIGTRSRTADALEHLLATSFTITHVDERPAVVRIGDAREYQRFHAATFGTYYSRIAGEERQAAFFEALGATAERRMRDQGFHTAMPVRLWACVRRGSADERR